MTRATLDMYLGPTKPNKNMFVFRSELSLCLVFKKNLPRIYVHPYNVFDVHIYRLCIYVVLQKISLELYPSVSFQWEWKSQSFATNKIKNRIFFWKIWTFSIRLNLFIKLPFCRVSLPGTILHRDMMLVKVQVVEHIGCPSLPTL